MKKIERSSLFLQENIHLFQCPVCQEGFQEVKGTSIICPSNHQFDISKKGTLHLLLKSGQNDYDKEMLESRKKLAETGFFHPILDAILPHFPKTDLTAVLDVGCGEGSHLHYLNQAGMTGTKIGFDISKAAINLAGTHHFEDAFWCVADLAQSPFAAGQFDAILNLFSPSHYQEFNRLLKPGGMVVKVVPEAEYLLELREKLYAGNKEKESYDNTEVVKRFGEAFPDFHQERVQYEIPLTKEMSQWLLEMTPLSWGAEESVRDDVRRESLTSVTVAVTILIGLKLKA